MFCGSARYTVDCDATSASDCPRRSRHDGEPRCTRQIRAWAEQSIAQFRREVVNGRVVVLTSGTHYVFITNEAEVVRVIREFVAQVIRS